MEGPWQGAAIRHDDLHVRDLAGRPTEADMWVRPYAGSGAFPGSLAGFEIAFGFGGRAPAKCGFIESSFLVWRSLIFASENESGVQRCPPSGDTFHRIAV
jgi:hypothetical protein